MIDLPKNFNCLNLSDFTVWKNSFILSEDIKDFSNFNLYRTVKKSSPDFFYDMPEDTSVKAGHRCHLSELFLDYIGGSHDFKKYASISYGVRDSINQLMIENKKWLIPMDVYPVYLDLANKNNINIELYSSQSKNFKSIILNGNFKDYSLLICDPLKPWGGELSDKEIEDLVDLSIKSNIHLVIDAAYDLKKISKLLKYIENNSSVTILGSLSKSWMEPMLAGFSLSSYKKHDFNKNLRLREFDNRKLRIAYWALSSGLNRPDKVFQIIEEWKNNSLKMLDLSGVSGLKGSGYFMSTEITPEELLLNNKCLAIPGSVFGGTGSVISVLPNITK